ncbi:MAG: beta-ketoacyl-ACP synthase [Gammaproteobacteria bacterium]|uniref:beta-ketoacyl-ACP synthase n=1 Tax=Stutzerimonas xanthomarina TaxID=271420 RepID=UPI00190D2A21|nr:beta-ketoacyl-ACP synthase [Stutzerimonas xanthomarina]MBU0810806.1 beta-ketoacyl-ACP synthase [Gammaproteobacteria bacterium]MBK3845023.1 beta-ketoacyl-ACP synthase [Stutzerimonas xanthomarina]MBU1302675.1 beta-ketoacyl-ACP synthase [Gammaproteobacteria bacterium]MBU1459550.1 beta-ketoacyl-ACP synthase [Gammaproteobacteria bacterium]MBU1773954.1 beta-ketoacyl-ACP synthase [Gammaproteobacteria bacterium]|tara:strand:- start:4697 stop:5923 length:1227 start_codon:yes stop_codon:yes gene_type:complete
MKRVVVTGMAGITSLGSDWASIEAHFSSNRSGIRYMPEWDRFTELNTRLAGPVDDFSVPKHWTRKQLRSMGRVSKLSVKAAEQALADAGLLDDSSIRDGRMGVACGSSTGSTEEIKAFGNMLLNSVADGLNANSYIRMMPHTTAANISIFFGLTGRVIPTSSACTSGSQGIGYAYEAIKFGRLPMMLAGGAEELCATEAMVFDALYATSLKNDAPHTSPRPYDAGRDGLVIGEGAGMLVLEELEHALARGATIHAELVGFGSNADGQHATKPEQQTMRRAMQLALEDACLQPDAIGYVNGHGTATEQGDIAETLATQSLFGSRMPISSQKSFLGHTLGACGALESWFSIEMMNRDHYIHTLNLDSIDPRCGELDYLIGAPRTMQHEYVMNNNFAFGGINTSLIFRRWA